jgi:hypothetical protein
LTERKANFRRDAMKRFAVALAAGVALLALPVSASSKGTCKTITQSYSASGQIDSWGMTLVSGNKYMGAFSADVTSENHAVKGFAGVTVNRHGTVLDITYMSVTAHVTFANGVQRPTNGDKVSITGTITKKTKACGTFTPTVTINKVSVSSRAHHTI